MDRKPPRLPTHPPDVKLLQSVLTLVSLLSSFPLLREETKTRLRRIQRGEIWPAELPRFQLLRLYTRLLTEYRRAVQPLQSADSSLLAGTTTVESSMLSKEEDSFGARNLDSRAIKTGPAVRAQKLKELCRGKKLVLMIRSVHTSMKCKSQEGSTKMPRVGGVAGSVVVGHRVAERGKKTRDVCSTGVGPDIEAGHWLIRLPCINAAGKGQSAV